MASAPARPQIVLFGDSITEQSLRPGGWGASLAHSFSGKADVIVRGYAGSSTRQALLLLPQIFPLSGPVPPVATTVFFRASGVPLDEYIESLKQIVFHLKEVSPLMLVVLITPPPLDKDGREQSLNGDEFTGAHTRKCAELAEELNLPCIDIWSKMQEKHFSSDGGPHLTAEGSELVHKELVQILRDFGISTEEDMQFDSPLDQSYFDIYPCSLDMLLDLPEGDDLVSDMVDPTSQSDDLLTSAPATSADHFDPLLLPLPDDAFLPASQGESSNGSASTPTCQDKLNAAQFDWSPYHLEIPTTPNSKLNFPKSDPDKITVKEERLSSLSSSPVSVLHRSSTSTPIPSSENTVQFSDPVSPPPRPSQKRNKKRKKNKSAKSKKKKCMAGVSTGQSSRRREFGKRCMHCQTIKTPQWREGPAGPRTLCNACGVRYSRGQLFPEYRPAGSPTFDPAIHSNFHAKVLEMRIGAHGH